MHKRFDPILAALAVFVTIGMLFATLFMGPKAWSAEGETGYCLVCDAEVQVERFVERAGFNARQSDGDRQLGAPAADY